MMVQYYEAAPFVFTHDQNYFVNTVQIALYEGHYEWWEFATHDTSRDRSTLVTSDEIGEADRDDVLVGSSLEYGIIHACEVIPPQADTPNS
jgi:hypothetical protein